MQFVGGFAHFDLHSALSNPPTPKGAQMQDELSLHLRAITFAANELALALIHLLQDSGGKDLECVLILLCVTDASMRPFKVQTPPVREVLAANVR